MTNNNNIVRLSNGAIDLAYYEQRGRKLRSEAIYDVLKTVTDRARQISIRVCEFDNPFMVPTSTYRECI